MLRNSWQRLLKTSWRGLPRARWSSGSLRLLFLATSAFVMIVVILVALLAIAAKYSTRTNGDAPAVCVPMPCDNTSSAVISGAIMPGPVNIADIDDRAKVMSSVASRHGYTAGLQEASAASKQGD